MEMKRKGLIIWVYSLKQVHLLKKFGLVHYQSSKMNYVVLYVDSVNLQTTIASIQRLHFVRHVEISRLDEIDMTFQDALLPVQEEVICE